MLAVVGLVIAEAVALGVNAFGADDDAREVAVAASRTYASTQSVEQARTTAEDAADQLGVELVSLGVDQDFVVVEVRRRADTIVWLVASDEAAGANGSFWHDREERPTHRLKKTEEQPDKRRRFMMQLAADAGPYLEPAPAATESTEPSKKASTGEKSSGEKSTSSATTS